MLKPLLNLERAKKVIEETDGEINILDDVRFKYLTLLEKKLVNQNC
jgi:hypothetical protein